MAAGAGRSREADPARCRRHPKHRHEAGVCPFCLRDRLSRLSAAAAGASASSSSGSSSPCSSWEETVALSSAQAPRPRRGNLGLLLRQEGREAAALAAGRRVEQEQHQEERTARRGSNFWARLQQQLHHGGWHRKDGCSEAAEKHGDAAATNKRAPWV
ncbi:hypothetical protein SEVIR_4G088400v4 [Setaria viridis]|uniref:DUF740 domain-containing protein n=2 Tax=Setaria TaxID=4554 RepID=A0A368QS89_SETIT|nr:uncharacterized protein LOC101764320 [Setaria italica]XP_034589460.1 uncharacterized protein LOC117851698 [Setaria viridis]RCV20827.1 hypothetical protein SETIT_4G089100v2 [Setaria italica]TKW20441.1 hypothetical protein SEVIR_4G088400v2 [Setaria viridis]